MSDHSTSAQDAVLSTAVYRSLGGRDRKFELRLGEIRELERLCESGIAAIYARVALLQFKADDLRETIRLGLIGGGAAQPEAEAIVRFSIDGRPLNEWVQLAADILKAVFDGVDTTVKTSGAEPSVAPVTSPPSTNSGEPLGSVQGKSTQ